MSDDVNPKRLFVGSLPWSIRDNELREAFEKAGKVVEATVATERDSGRSKGFGFVEMETEDDARVAIEMYHEKDLGGRTVFVSIAKPKTNRRDY